MRVVWIAIGGAIGAAARYALAGAVHRVTPPFFPYGTFAVNVVGCLLFGIVVGLADERFAVGPTARAFILIGVLGGFTTFSSYTFETLELLRAGQVTPAIVNSAGQVFGGLVALWAGYTVARSIW